MIATDGGFRPDGTFVPWPAHDTTALTEAFRRAVLRLFVRRGLFEREDAEAMLAWPHAGFHVHDAVLVPDGDTAFALRLARYCARNPVALERLAYEASARHVRYRSDKADGPTAGTEIVDPLEFLARVTAHIPNKHQVMTRYYGYYANRVRGARRRREHACGRPPARGRAGAAPAPRGAAALGGALAADLRGRSATVPAVRRRDADRRFHHAARGDRSDPRSPPPRPGLGARAAEDAAKSGAPGTGASRKPA